MFENKDISVRKDGQKGVGMPGFVVDIIIPSYKPDEKFEKLIGRLLKQKYPIHKIFIVNTDEKFWRTSKVLSNEKLKVTHIKKEEFNHGGTRNRAAEKSEADILIFMTQDAMPLNDMLVEELVKPFQDDLVGASYARQLPEKDCGEIEKYTRSFNYPAESIVKSKEDVERLGIKTYFCSNVCGAYRSRIYHELGGFEKRTIFNEDMIYCGKMVQSGYKVAYAAAAEVIHSHNYGCMQQFHRNFDLAVSQAEHPEIFSGIKSEGEGLRLVKKSAGHCLKIGKPWLLFELIMKSAFKYMGYLLGKNYTKLPQWFINKCTMNKMYWCKKSEKSEKKI